jgi:hypothetical protein
MQLPLDVYWIVGVAAARLALPSAIIYLFCLAQRALWGIGIIERELQ